MKVAVVGAGPAGLLCAWRLATAGHQVVIFERKSNLDTQGSGVLIQPVALRVLEALGLSDELRQLGHRITRVEGFVNARSGRKVINADYGLLRGDFNYALGLDRGALWSLLHRKVVASGAELFAGESVQQLRYTDDKNCVLIGKDHSELGSFELVIDASGATSPLRKYTDSQSSATVLQYGSIWTKVPLPDSSPYNNDSMVIYTGEANRGVGLMPIGKKTRIPHQ